jgi:gamma-glutamyltranspeptidase/glutathione hydrolase
MSAEQVFHSPRFSTNHFVSSFGQEKARLGSLQVPSTLSAAAQEQLKNRGHALTTGRDSVGGVALLVLDPTSGNAVGVGSSAEHAK